MKYYYKGVLVRTSKSHQYTHAAIRELNNGKIKVYGCSSTEMGKDIPSKRSDISKRCGLMMTKERRWKTSGQEEDV